MSDQVVDASIVGKLLFPEEHSDQAIALFGDAGHGTHQLIAPFVLPVEVTNLIRRRMRRIRLPLLDALAALDDFLVQPVELLGDANLHREALRLTEAHSLGAHDAPYVALAQRLACELWTADEQLLRAVREQLPFVRYIGDYASAGGSASR